MARSIRTRITLLATGVTLSVCILVCVAVYVGLYLSLYREVDSFLEGEVREFGAILAHNGDGALRDVEREIRAELGSRRGADLAFRLLDHSGQLLITSDPVDRFPNPWPLSGAATHAHSVAAFETVDAAQDGAPAPYRFCLQAETLPGHGAVVIQAAYRLDRVNRSLAICRLVCIVAVLIAAALSFLGGRAVARGSMSPVVEITKAARQIGALQLSSRVPLAGTNDELDELAQTLNEMLERVERSFRQIQQFTADAAHELRTPLTALRGSAELVLAQPRSEAQLRAVIEKSIDYYRLLGRLTDDLLLLATLDAGQAALRFDRCDLSRIVEDVVDLYRPLAADRGIEIRVHGDGETWMVGDHGKIRRVLNNLLDNSIKYMAGGGVVDVTFDEANGAASLEVKDNGPGIAPDDLKHVFERFYRADRARSSPPDTDGRSAGLGLAICRAVIRAHGGTMDIESSLNVGTRLMIRLPIDGKMPAGQTT